MQNKAFFLDRDGTVIIDKGYLDDPLGIEFIKGIPELLQKAQAQGFLIVIVSNQSGVARGYFDKASVQRVNEALQNKLKKEYGVKIDGIYYCPHHPKYGNEQYGRECNCRKPKPGMILMAAEDLNIDISMSLMVGDKDSDRIELLELDFLKVEKDKDWSKAEKLQKFLIKGDADV